MNVWRVIYVLIRILNLYFDKEGGKWTTRIGGKVLIFVTGIFNLPNPPSRTMALGSTQPLTEMSTRNLPGGKGRTARKADNLTAISEPVV
jgi:hypothetical protein